MMRKDKEMPKSRKFIPSTSKHAKIVRAIPHKKERDRTNDSLLVPVRLPKLWCDALEKMYPYDSLAGAAKKHIILTIIPDEAQESKVDAARDELLKRLLELIDGYVSDVVEQNKKG